MINQRTAIHRAFADEFIKAATGGDPLQHMIEDKSVESASQNDPLSTHNKSMLTENYDPKTDLSQRILNLKKGTPPVATRSVI